MLWIELTGLSYSFVCCSVLACLDELAHKWHTRITVNLRKSEFETKGNPKEEARYYFFQFISQDILAELNPLFRLFYEIITEHRTCNDPLNYYDPLRIPSLKQRLITWAKPHHIDSEWVYKKVVEMFWEQYENVPDEMRGSLILSLKVFEDIDHITPPPKGFDSYLPGTESRQEYLDKCKNKVRRIITRHPILSLSKAQPRKRFIESILYKIEDYCRKVEKHFELQPDWQRTKQTEIRWRNAKWAVKFQVEKLSYSDIARDSNVSTSTVKRGVDEILSLIGLDKRPDSKRGRKQGSKNSYTAKIISGLGR